MNAAIEIGLYVGFIPAVTALALFFAMCLLLPESVARRYAAGGSLAAAVFIGFALLPSTRPLAPSQFWEWIPPLGLLAALVAGLARADGVGRGERGLVTLLACLLAAWLVVPMWEGLSPPRSVQVPLAAAGMFCLAVLIEPLPERLAGRAVPLWLMLAAGTTALLIMAEVSETLGRLAGLPAAALAGCGTALLLAKSNVDQRALALPYAILAVGCAFTGYVYPSPPLVLLLVVPAAPLALWIMAYGPAARLSGRKALAAQAACVLIPLLGITVAVLRGGSGVSGY